jgi:hypothetical protein
VVQRLSVGGDLHGSGHHGHAGDEEYGPFEASFVGHEPIVYGDRFHLGDSAEESFFRLYPGEDSSATPLFASSR